MCPTLYDCRRTYSTNNAPAFSILHFGIRDCVEFKIKRQIGFQDRLGFDRSGTQRYDEAGVWFGFPATWGPSVRSDFDSFTRLRPKLF